MAPSTAKVLSARARHVTAAKTSDAASAEATDVTSAKAARVASAKAAAHVASATTSVSSAATAAAGLGISGKKAARKHGTCQNHHHSSSHDILLLGWAGLSATGSRQTVVCANGKRQRRDRLEMGMLACPPY
jgi:hypothetical protein